MFTNTEQIPGAMQVEAVSDLDYAIRPIAFPEVAHSRYPNKDAQITYNLANGNFDNKIPSTQVSYTFLCTRRRKSRPRLPTQKSLTVNPTQVRGCLNHDFA